VTRLSFGDGEGMQTLVKTPLHGVAVKLIERAKTPFASGG
jgi:hypothetical protein